jgi:hypothetical protein
VAHCDTARCRWCARNRADAAELSGSVVSGVISGVLGVLLLLASLSLFFRRQFLTLAGIRLLAIEPKQTTLLTMMTDAVLGVLVTISSLGAGALGVTALLLLYPRLADGDHRRVRHRPCGAADPGGRYRALVSRNRWIGRC